MGSAELSRLPVSRLKALAASKGVSLEGCVEKQHLVAALCAAGITADGAEEPPQVVAPPPSGGGPTDAGATGSRHELKRRVFALWDVDRDGFLKRDEMLQVARCVGFDAPEEEWATEYIQVCSESGCQPDVGMSAAAVMALLDDRSDAGCYLSDSSLEKILSQVSSGPGEAEVTADPRDLALLDRGELKRLAFRVWDSDGDGSLKEGEMLKLARSVGFEGPDEDFSEEYREMCAQQGCSREVGVPEAAILVLLDDESDRGCFISSGELRQMLAATASLQTVRLAVPPASPTPTSVRPPAALPLDRGALKRRVFIMWDADQDGLLNSAEMLQLARSLGFDGTQEEWAGQYEEMCAQHSCKVEAGFPQELVLALMDDESDAGMHIPSEELAQLLAQADSAPRVPSPTPTTAPSALAPPAPTFTSPPSSTPPSVATATTTAAHTPAPTPPPAPQSGVAPAETAPGAQAPTAAAAAPAAPSSEAAATPAPQETQAPTPAQTPATTAAATEAPTSPATVTPPSAAVSTGTAAAGAPPEEAERKEEPARPRRKAEDEGDAVLRASLKRRVFLLWDLDGDGALKKEELLKLARHVGFDGNVEEWSTEYAQMCTQRGCSARYGMSEEAYNEFLDDDSETGCYFSNEELAKIIAAADEAAAATKRDLVMLCNEDGTLNKEEMVKIAAWVGFVGSDTDLWCKEFGQIVSDSIGAPTGGLSKEAVVALAERARGKMPEEMFKKGDEAGEAGKTSWRQKRQQKLASDPRGPKGVEPPSKKGRTVAPPSKAEIETAAEKRKRRCDGCEEEPAALAVIRCLNCEAYLCAKCNEANHPTALLKKHTRQPLAQDGVDAYKRFRFLFNVGDQWQLTTSIALWRYEWGWEKIGGINAQSAWGGPNIFQIMECGDKRLKVKGMRGGGENLGWVDVNMLVDKYSGELLIRPFQPGKRN